jgi:hypothetical protein
MENKMKRTNIYLTERQHEAIQREADEKQITFSERFRQIIENYMEKKNEKV